MVEIWGRRGLRVERWSGEPAFPSISRLPPGSSREGETEPIPVFGAWDDLFAPFRAVIGNQVHRISVMRQYLCDLQTGIVGICFEDEARANFVK